MIKTWSYQSQTLQVTSNLLKVYATIRFGLCTELPYLTKLDPKESVRGKFCPGQPLESIPRAPVASEPPSNVALDVGVRENNSESVGGSILKYQK